MAVTELRFPLLRRLPDSGLYSYEQIAKVDQRQEQVVMWSSLDPNPITYWDHVMGENDSYGNVCVYVVELRTYVTGST